MDKKLSQDANYWSSRIFKALTHSGNSKPMLIEAADAQSIMILLDKISQQPTSNKEAFIGYVKI